ncbi:glycosyltransferase [Aliarcobacter thereius]|uniref:glycosyltransferase n=1 Tax=Aliarcobacter thereius TaxID=544718 RepID=UPI0010FEFAC5|nr:glycosyltransferase [Aliarcobacter thereius]TLT05664.1 glycosyltransferase [Aliarcobacter thereius]
MSFEWIKKTNNFVVHNKEKLPISIVLVVIKSRLEFVNAFVIPSIKANNPAEIIIVDDEDLTNQEKRNKGASLATQKYLFICDDDVVMPSNHLSILCKVLEDNDGLSFAYTDYQAIVMDPLTHPKGANYYQRSRPFDLEFLKFNNYIDTCSLVRKDSFPGFDPEIKRFQDWDLWLTMGLKGFKGVYVEETGIIKYYLDEGITSKKISAEESRNIVLQKHNLSGLLSIIFIDTGKGFNAKESIAKELNLKNGKFEILFELNQYLNIKKLRFDPVESRICSVKNLMITYTINGKEEKYENSLRSNAKLVNNGHYTFDTLDPQFHLSVKGKIDFVRIEGEMFFDNEIVNSENQQNNIIQKVKSFFS